MRIVGSAVGAYVEDLGVDGQPFEVALSCGRSSSVRDPPVKMQDMACQWLETYLSVQ
jgi:hypothetical protein